MLPPLPLEDPAQDRSHTKEHGSKQSCDHNILHKNSSLTIFGYVLILEGQGDVQSPAPRPYLSQALMIASIIRPDMIPEKMSIAKSIIFSRSAVGFRLRRFLIRTLNFITSLA